LHETSDKNEPSADQVNFEEMEDNEKVVTNEDLVGDEEEFLLEGALAEKASEEGDEPSAKNNN